MVATFSPTPHRLLTQMMHPWVGKSGGRAWLQRSPRRRAGLPAAPPLVRNIRLWASDVNLRTEIRCSFREKRPQRSGKTGGMVPRCARGRVAR
jgi:hypothetical protein